MTAGSPLPFAIQRNTEPPAEDLVRADTYHLLATLLREPPAAELLQILSAVDTRALPGPLAAAWDRLRLASTCCSVEEMRLEFEKLFVGLGRGQVVPYASWYAEGLLMGKPLARLRQDLARLKLKRRPQVFEPEDHAAALCEAMALMCRRNEASCKIQARFFHSHLFPWLLELFVDLQKAGAAAFYDAAARLGECFLRMEQEYFNRILPKSVTGGNHYET